MNTQRNDSAIAGQIGALVKRWSEAVRERDTDAIMACYHSDVIAFDAINQLQFKGLDAYRQHWAACLDMCPGAMLFEQHDLRLARAQPCTISSTLAPRGASGVSASRARARSRSAASASLRPCSGGRRPSDSR